MPTLVIEGTRTAVVAVALSVACDRCGTKDTVLADALIAADQLQLRLLEDLGEFELPLGGCPSCGGALGLQGGTAAYTPDDEGCATLVCESVRDGGEIVSSWRLRDPGGATRPLRDVDEWTLSEAWGRPLSVRDLLRLAMARASENPLEPVRVAAGPGLWFLTIAFDRVPDLGEPRDVSMVDEAMSAHLPAATLGLADPVVLLSSAYHGAGDVADWAGPYGAALRRGQMILFALVDMPAAEAALVTEADRLGATPATLAPAELPEAVRRLQSDLQERRWFALEGHRFWIPDTEHPWLAAGQGLTLAEAAVPALGASAARTRRLADLFPRIEREFSPIPVSAPLLSSLIIGTLGEAGEAVLVNLESLADKNPSDDALIEQLRGQAARFRERTMECGCDQEWYLGQVRLPEDPAVLDDAIQVGELTDERGTRFVLVATCECPHQIVYLRSSSALRPDDAELEDRLAEGPARARIVMLGKRVSGIGARPAGAVLRGDRIASSLAHPPLAAALADALGNAGLRGDLLAIAPTTDVVLIQRLDEGPTSLVRSAFLEARRSWGEVPGAPLGFVSRLPDPEPARGRITIRWEGASRAERRARR